MRTFKFDFSLEVKAVVPESFLAGQLDAARDEDATKFQQQLIAKYDAAVYGCKGDPEGVSDAGDEFLLELLSNGLRMGLRGHALAMLESSGLGGTVAPVQVLERTAVKPELIEEEVVVK